MRFEIDVWRNATDTTRRIERRIVIVIVVVIAAVIVVIIVEIAVANVALNSIGNR